MQVSWNSARLTHPGSFSPLLRFPLDFDALSSETYMNDSGPLSLTEPLNFKASLTAASLIEEFQPTSIINSHFFYSSTQGLPACIECSPGCATCSSMESCTVCGAGTLTHGICLDVSVSPSTGRALDTLFTLDDYYFYEMNYHAITQLKLNPLQDYITLITTKIRFPDSSEQIITRDSENQFQVPKYRVVGATSFTAQFIVVYSFSGSTYETTVATLSMTQDYTAAESLRDQIQTAEIDQTESDLCGCSPQGVCDELQGTCICNQNYSGYYCEYQVDQLLQFQNQVSWMLTSIEDNLSSFTTYDALQELEYLSSERDTLVHESAHKCFDLLETLFTDYSNTTEVDKAFEVLSHLSSKASQEDGSALDYTDRLQGVAAQVVQHAIAANSTLNIQSSKIHAQSLYFQDLVPSADYLPSNSSTTSVALPSSLPFNQSRRWLVSILYDEHIYQSRAPSSRISSSEVLTLELYVDGVRQHLQDLEQPILMKFAVDKNNALLMKEVRDVVEGRKQLDSIGCYYFDKQLQVPWRAGCELVAITMTEMTCACDHMTDFMGFLKTGLDVIKQSNYNALFAITQLNPQNLRNNLGFFVALGFIGSYFLLLIIALSIDHVKLRTHFFHKLFLLVNRVPSIDSRHEDSVFIILNTTSKSREEMEVNKKKQQKRIVPQIQHSTATEFKLTKKDSKKRVYGQEELDTHSVLKDVEFDSFSQQADKPAKNETPMRSNERNSSIFSKKTELSSFSRLNPPLPGSDANPSTTTISEIKERISKILETERHRHCCCKFQKLVRNELATNNQAYNLITKTSPLNRRATRLTICYFALVVEFASCAFFFNLSPNSPNVPLFWDRIIENFWVATYSTLFLMMPLLLLGCFFTVPSKALRALRKASSPENIQFYYKKVQKNLRTKMIVGFILLSLLVYFLLIYIVCFCHIASRQMQQDWVVSSVLSIAMDLVVMEIAPAVFIGCLGVLRSKCGERSGLMCVIVGVELYRFYRNLVAG